MITAGSVAVHYMYGRQEPGKMSGEERKMKTYRIEVLFLEFGASGVEKMEAAGTSTRVVLEVLCHLGRMGVDEDGGRLKQGDARPPGVPNWWCREAVPPGEGGSW